MAEDEVHEDKARSIFPALTASQAAFLFASLISSLTWGLSLRISDSPENTNRGWMEAALTSKEEKRAKDPSDWFAIPLDRENKRPIAPLHSIDILLEAFQLLLDGRLDPGGSAANSGEIEL